jgi:RHS repeat-associated protein
LYNAENNLYGFNYNGNNYYYLKDCFNTIYGIIDNEGNVIVKYKYTAYGQLISVVDGSQDNLSQKNPFLYKGYYYDVETGLFMMGHRYYSPELCRFIQPDDIEYLNPSSINGLNLYCYCFNNPIMYVDSSGHFPVAIEVINTIVDGAASLYEFGLKRSLKYFKNMPDITMDVAKKMARKGGHIQSARQIMRHKQNLINSTQQSLDDVVKFGKKMGKVLLVADIAWSLGENILSGEESWFTDSLIDIGISVGLYFLPGGFFVSLGASILLTIFDDKIEEFKDDFYEGWSNFWSFSWI